MPLFLLAQVPTIFEINLFNIIDNPAG